MSNIIDDDAQGTPLDDAGTGATPSGDNDPFEGIGETPGVISDEPSQPEAEQDDSSQEEETNSDEPSKPAQAKEDNSLTEPGGQSYEELRKKLNDQGIEKNQFKEELDSFKGKSDQLSADLQTAHEELEAYKEWYSKYYPALNDLWQDPEIRKKIDAAGKGKTLSERDVKKLLDEQVAQKLQEHQSQSEFERSVDTWLDTHPDVKGQLAKDLYTYLDKHDLTPEPDILEMAYTFLTKDKLKEIGAKKKEIEQEKLKKASVGGGATKAAPAPKSTVDDLFATPSSSFYPNA